MYIGQYVVCVMVVRTLLGAPPPPLRHSLCVNSNSAACKYVVCVLCSWLLEPY